MRKIISIIILASFLFPNTAYPSSTLRVPVGKIDRERVQNVAFNIFLSLTESRLTEDEAASYLDGRRQKNRKVLIVKHVVKEGKPTIEFEIKPATEIPEQVVTGLDVLSDNWYDVYKLKDKERIDKYPQFTYVLVTSPIGMGGGRTRQELEQRGYRLKINRVIEWIGLEYFYKKYDDTLISYGQPGDFGPVGWSKGTKISKDEIINYLEKEDHHLVYAVDVFGRHIYIEKTGTKPPSVGQKGPKDPMSNVPIVAKKALEKRNLLASNLSLLKTTPVLFLDAEVVANPDDFSQALEQLKTNEGNIPIILLTKETEQSIQGKLKDISLEGVQFRTLSELGLQDFKLDEVMSLIVGIDNLKAIPLTDSLTDAYETLKKARDQV